MHDLSRFNYFAVRWVVKAAAILPVAIGIVVLVSGVLFWGVGAVTVALSILLAGVSWFLTRVFVEIVVVVADTLLPR